MSLFDRLQLFVPDARLESKATPVDLHDRWVVLLMRTCANLFGGATSYGRGAGVWKSGDDYFWDRVTVGEAWADTRKADHAERVATLVREMRDMGLALRQEAVALIIAGELYIFPIGGQP